MKYLLDTNVLSELRPDKPRASAAVLSWASNVPIGAQYTSPLCLMEIEIGILRLERRRPPQGAALRAWLGRVRELFLPRLLMADDAVCQRCAPLHVPDKRPAHDALIAATALVHGMTLVTRNTADFERTGVMLLNPWEDPISNITQFP